MSLKRKSKNGGSVPKTLTAFFIAAGMFVAVCLITSVIAFCTADPMSLVKPFSICALIISAALASFISSKRGGMASAILSALIFTLIMLIFGVVISGGKTNAGALINYVCYMLTSLLFAYLASRAPKKRWQRRRR